MTIFGLITRKDQEIILAKKTAEFNAQLEALKASLPNYAEWLLETADAERYNLPDPAVYGVQAEFFRLSDFLMQAVDITASAGALTEFEVKRVVKGKEPKDIPGHDFEMLLNKPNPLDSRYEFLYATIAEYLLTGNSYWYINAKDEFSPPDELWFIPSDHIQPIPDEQSYLKGYYYYPGNGREMFMEPWQIVHFRRFNVNSRFVGLSKLEAIALILRGDLGMQRANAKLYGENNGRLPGILSFEQMIAQPIWDKIKEDTREASRNHELLMLRGTAQGGPKWQQASATYKDMEFIAGRKQNQEEIYNSIAPGLYAWISQDSTMANSLSNRAAFSELTVYPIHVMMSEKITNDILVKYSGRELLGCFEDVRVADRQLELKEQEEFSKTHTVSEIREEFYGDDPLGDERDDMLLPEADAFKTVKTAPPPPPAGAPNPLTFTPQDNQQNSKQPQQPGQQNVTPQSTQTNQDYQNAVAKMDSSITLALNGWQRIAVKHVGKPIDYDDKGALPVDVVRFINRNLPACKTGSDVRGIFTQARGMLFETDKVASANDVIEAMRISLKALEVMR